jgi:Flp pilus assembly protein TadD
MNATFDVLLEQAVAVSQAAQWSEASTLLAAASELRPEAPEPHYLRAANFAATGDFAAAEAEFSACLALAPHLAIARFQFGLLYVTTGRPDAARSVWEPLLATRHPLSWFARAMLAILHGDRTNADAWIRQGLQTHRENAPLNANMAALLEKLAQLDSGPSTAGQPGEQSGPVPGETPADPDSSTHLLIASYTQR